VGLLYVFEGMYYNCKSLQNLEELHKDLHISYI